MKKDIKAEVESILNCLIDKYEVENYNGMAIQAGLNDQLEPIFYLANLNTFGSIVDIAKITPKNKDRDWETIKY